MTAPLNPDVAIDTLIENFTRTKALQDASSTTGPTPIKRKEVTVEDFQKVLDSTPLFMRETPEGMEDNPVLDALRSLVFEGEGDEVALNFKDHGNELYVQKSYKDAVVAYTSGIDAGPTDGTLRITLLSNRAACNLALKNYGLVLKDAGTVIALCVQEKKAVPPKALFRAAQALIGLERWREARDVVNRGKEGDEKTWRELEGKIDRGTKVETERAERLRRERLGKKALREAIESRGVMIIDTPSPPDNPHPLHFDPTSLPTLSLSETSWTAPPITTPLIYPVFLLYPSHAQSDLITHFDETTSFNDQLGVMFPASSNASSGWAEWDTKREYYLPNLVVYVETRHRRLLKCGKDLPLVDVIAKAVKLDEGKKIVDGVILRDGLLSFVVLIKGEQEKAWIADFKSKRDS